MKWSPDDVVLVLLASAVPILALMILLMAVLD